MVGTILVRGRGWKHFATATFEMRNCIKGRRLHKLNPQVRTRRSIWPVSWQHASIWREERPTRQLNTVCLLMKGCNREVCKFAQGL
eukprot:scaffold4171_cov185-Skeletonema_menzelii.AAC.2